MYQSSFVGILASMPTFDRWRSMSLLLAPGWASPFSSLSACHVWNEWVHACDLGSGLSELEGMGPKLTDPRDPIERALLTANSWLWWDRSVFDEYCAVAGVVRWYAVGCWHSCALYDLRRGDMHRELRHLWTRLAGDWLGDAISSVTEECCDFFGVNVFGGLSFETTCWVSVQWTGATRGAHWWVCTWKDVICACATISIYLCWIARG